MKSDHKLHHVVFITLITLMILIPVGCGSGGGGGGSSSGGDTQVDVEGNPSTATITSIVPPGDECPYGGIRVDTGIDENGNGIVDRNEYWLDSSLFQTDSDLDLLSDAMEMIIGTDVLVPDTDVDLILDGWEYQYGLDPLDASDAQEDADNDGVSNYDEFVNSLNPHSADSDSDLMPDLFELENLALRKNRVRIVPGSTTPGVVGRNAKRGQCFSPL